MHELKLSRQTVKTELSNLSKFGILIFYEKKEEIKNLEEKNNETVDEKLKTSEVKTEKVVSDVFINSIKKEKIKKETKKTKEENTFYQVNTDFVLYEEIRILMFKAQILYEKDFSLKVADLGKLQLLIFTGFFVNNSESSVDLFIVGDINRDKLVTVVNDLEKDLGREVNYTVMDEREFKYRSEITDVFLYNVLDGKKIISINRLGIV
jgi:hypothetical protein